MPQRDWERQDKKASKKDRQSRRKNKKAGKKDRSKKSRKNKKSKKNKKKNSRKPKNQKKNREGEASEVVRDSCLTTAVVTFKFSKFKTFVFGYGR